MYDEHWKEEVLDQLQQISIESLQLLIDARKLRSEVHQLLIDARQVHADLMPAAI